MPMPLGFNNLDMFKKSLFIKCVRPEKIMFMMKKFITQKIGDEYANPPPVKLQDMLEDTDERTPIIFILSKGADPSDSIKDLARTRNNKEVKELSLGSGSEDKAVNAIQRGAVEG